MGMPFVFLVFHHKPNDWAKLNFDLKKSVDAASALMQRRMVGDN